MNILDFIPVGRENAISCRELSDLLHIPKRVVTRTIEKARREGIPICAANTAGAAMGFYRAESREELAEYVRRYHSRIQEIQLNCQGLENALAEWTGE